MRRFESLTLLLLLSSISMAQSNTMEEVMYSSGKIYVVIAVILIILAGLFIYLFRMEKRIKQLEEEEERFTP